MRVAVWYVYPDGGKVPRGIMSVQKGQPVLQTWARWMVRKGLSVKPEFPSVTLTRAQLCRRYQARTLKGRSVITPIGSRSIRYIFYPVGS